MINELRKLLNDDMNKCGYDCNKTIFDDGDDILDLFHNKNNNQIICLCEDRINEDFWVYAWQLGVDWTDDTNCFSRIEDAKKYFNELTKRK